MIQGMTNSTMTLEAAEAARGNPRGASSMGQFVPGIPAETQKTVIYGAVALIGLSLVLFLALRPRRQRSLQNAK